MANLNSGKPWSEMDLADLRNGLSLGTPIEELADLRAGTTSSVKSAATR